MKKIYIFLLTITSLFGNSCSTVMTPELYDEEIRDAVKFHIAEAEYIVDLASNPFFLIGSFLLSDEIERKINNLESKINETYTNSDMDYRQVLLHFANDNTSDYRDEAGKILKYYDALNVSLTDYTQISNSLNYSSWTFDEIHSGIEFVFEIHHPAEEEEGTTWSCSPVESSIELFVLTNI